MTKTKRLLAFLLAFLLTVSLCACGGGGDAPGGSNTPGSSGNKEDELAKKLRGLEKVKLEHVYTMEYMKAELEQDCYLQNIQEQDGEVYLSLNFSREIPAPEDQGGRSWESGVKLCRVSADGSSMETLFTKMNLEDYNEEERRSSYEGVDGLFLAQDGTIWYMLQKNWSDWSDEENYQYGDESFLVQADLQGNELRRISGSAFSEEEGWFYINSFTVLPDGSALMMTGNSLLVLNADMSVRHRVKNKDDEWVNSVAVTGSGAVVELISGYNQATQRSRTYLAELNPATGALTDLGELPLPYVNTITGGPGDTLVLQSSQDALFSYDIRSKSLTELLNWLNSDINPNRIGITHPLSDGRFLAVEYNRDWSGQRLAFLKPNADMVEKYIIRFASVYLDDNIREAIIDYNKQNDTFRITFEDYSRFNTENDYTLGLQKLNQDIVSGNIPDMFSMEGLPYDAYVSQGRLADLSKRMEQDESFHRSDYLDSVFQALERDGKVYSAIIHFSLLTLAAKESYVGGQPGWTMEDLRELMRRHPEAAVLSDMERSDALTTLLGYCMSSYIDWETGKCAFNTPGFVQLLELVAQFPETIDWNSYYDDKDPTYWQEQENQYREGRTLLYPLWLDNYTSIKNLAYQFGGDYSLIGYPVPEGVGSAIQPNMEIAISANTKLDDPCWDFVRYLLGEDFQTNLPWSFPVYRPALQKMQEEAMKPVDWEDDYGYPAPVPRAEEEATPGDLEETGEETEEETGEETEEETGEETVSGCVSGIAIATEAPVFIDPGYEEDDWSKYWNRPVTQEMADQINEAINGVKYVVRDQTDIIQIIEEEAGAFFSGQKSAQAVAETIQSRVSLTIMESM